jgi:nitrite reductase/ring-hydroxylating ferredoxin subunit
MSLVDGLADRASHIEIFDGVASKVSKAVGRITDEPPVSNIVSGTWLGHPLHPMWTDVPIGCWTSAFLLDFLPGARARRASRTLIGLGVLAAVPTAATGVSDWADTGGATRRIGVVHALINSSALALYALSWRTRHRGHHFRGVMLSLVGGDRGHDRGVARWPPRVPQGHRRRSQHLRPDAGGLDATRRGARRPRGCRWLRAARRSARVLAIRRGGGTWRGIGARCSHRDGPLQEGTFADDCVTCPWHHSRFRLSDGGVVNGPATAPEPRYDVAEEDGRFRVRHSERP